MITLDRWMYPDHQRVLVLFEVQTGFHGVTVPILRFFEGVAYSYEDMLVEPRLGCMTGQYEVIQS